MNRSELIAQLSRRTELSVDGARRAVEALFGTSNEAGLIATALQQGERVQLAGFGSFETRQRKERPGRNPHTHASIVIPACVAPVFKPAGHLKEVCAEGNPAAAGGARSTRPPARAGVPSSRV
jgi:DNA-binding protein HU-beta